MSAHTTKFITWLWIASLSIATVGVSGTQIYCYCMGKTTFELFANEDSCAEKQKNQAKTCCAVAHKEHVRDCCEKKEHHNPSKGCTKKTTKVFQLKTEFTVQEKLAQKFPSLPFGPLLAVLSFPEFQSVLRRQYLGKRCLAQPPPALSGRLICVRNGVFRC